MRVTNHAKKRSKERSGVTKGQIDNMAKRAFHEGITHKQARNELSRWMDAEFLKYKTANECRFYANHLYIFHNQTLITILDADPKYEKDLENYVDSFKTFVTYQRNRIKRKTNPELMRQLNHTIRIKLERDNINQKLSEISPDYSYHIYSVDNGSQAVISYFTNKHQYDIEESIKQYIKSEYGLSTQFKKLKGDI